MQVRSIEFQENFRLVTLEASRQQSVINRGGVVAGEDAAYTLQEARAADLERPNPSDEPRAGRVVDEGERRQGRAGRRRESRDEAPEDSTDQEQRGLPAGQSIDLLA